MISVVIPAYNEEKIIEDAAKTLTSALERDFGDDFELILVNDGSLDTTGEKICALAEKDSRIKPSGYEKNRGKGHAVRFGVSESVGDVVLFTDADLAYGADIIKKFYDTVKNDGCGAAIGSRNLGEDGYSAYTLKRKIMSKCYLALLHLLCGFKYSDSQCGIKAFRGDEGRRIFAAVETDGFAFDLEALCLAQKIDLKIEEVPVKIINHRDSKVNPLKDSIKMLRDLIKIRRRVKKKNI